ncbi:MAG: ergothioneine biosynthesis protein EgtC [Actinomycetota bacterium]
MCRHLAYLGPPVTLAESVLHQPHSLLQQSWAPSDMRGGGTINADGFGIGWLGSGTDAGGNGTDSLRAGGEGPRRARRYRRDRPMWSDATLPELAASITSGAVLAAVRCATVGMPVTESACAPFVEGPAMFSHNGVIDRWPDSVAALAGALPPAVLMKLDAPTDSAFLWALVREHLRKGRSAATALAEVVADVLALAPRSRLNLLLNDGRVVAATTVSHSLWVLQGENSVTVSSEALDPGNPRWQAVPNFCLLEASATFCSIKALSDPTGVRATPVDSPVV